MTDLQQALADLDLEYATVIKDYYERRQALLARVSEEMAAGDHFQDERDGTVFEITEPAGKFVRFERLSWQRTRRGNLGETKAGLSMKRAEEFGYVLTEVQKVVVPLVD